MNIDQICRNLLELTENSFALTGLCEAGFDWQELIELARQRNELLKAAKNVVEISREGERYQIIIEGIEPLETVIKSCE